MRSCSAYALRHAALNATRTNCVAEAGVLEVVELPAEQVVPSEARQQPEVVVPELVDLAVAE